MFVIFKLDDVKLKLSSDFKISYFLFACIVLSRFHAYAITTELDLYERTSMAPSENTDEYRGPLGTEGSGGSGGHGGGAGRTQSTLVQRKKVYGGIPDGAGVRQDVMLVFEELEEARNNLGQITSIMKEQNQRLITGTNTVFKIYL